MSYHTSTNVPRSAGRHTTHPCLHIRNAADAQVVFEGVRLNVLPMIRRRLGPTERDMLRSGEIFVWEETDQKGGLERWTDGRRWSQSRMREPFLYYEEKEPTTKEEKEAKAARRNDPSTMSPSPSRRQDRPSKPDGLTKQTYSIYVNLGQVTRKWHLVAYFSGSDYTRLPVVEDYDYLRRIRVPKGIYISSKGLQMQSDSSYDNDEDEPYSPISGSSRSPSVYHPPTPYATSSVSTSTPYPGMSRGHQSYGSGSNSRGSSHVSSPYVAAEGPDYMTPYTTSRHANSNHAPEYSAPRSPSDSRPYIPLTSEDKRALGAFRVAL